MKWLKKLMRVGGMRVKNFTIKLANCSTISATCKCEWHKNWQIVVPYLQHINMNDIRTGKFAVLHLQHKLKWHESQQIAVLDLQHTNGIRASNLWYHICNM